MSTDNFDLLTSKQIRFVAAWAGNATLAARDAGYSNPRVAGNKLMQIPAVANAIRLKQRALLEESGKRIGTELTFTRTDVLNRLWEVSQHDLRSTPPSFSVQLQALIALAELLVPGIDSDEPGTQNPG